MHILNVRPSALAPFLGASATLTVENTASLGADDRSGRAYAAAKNIAYRTLARGNVLLQRGLLLTKEDKEKMRAKTDCLDLQKELETLRSTR